MASIWQQGPDGGPATKLKGHLNPTDALTRLSRTARRLADTYKAKVVASHDFEVHLRTSGGGLISLYIEPCSPPSAPEVGQPAVKGGHGVLARKVGGHVALVELKLPPGEAA